jgi:hypothetical protein
MITPEFSELSLTVSSAGAPEEEIDRMTRQLLSELRDMDVERAELTKAGAAPDGTKAFDPVATGSIMISVLPAILPKVIDGIQSWVMRGSNRTVKFKGKIAGQPVEFEGSGEDLQKLLTALGKTGQKK